MADHKVTVNDEELAVLENLRQRNAERIANQAEADKAIDLSEIKPGMSPVDFERAARQTLAALKEWQGS